MLPVTHGEAFTRLHILLYHFAGRRISIAFRNRHVWPPVSCGRARLGRGIPLLGDRIDPK